MKVALIIYTIGTMMLFIAMVRQFKILSSAPDRDPMLKSKLYFFLYNLFTVLTIICLVFARLFRDDNLMIPSATFYFIMGCIALWAYYSKHKTL